MKSIGKVLLPVAIGVGIYALFIFDPSVAVNDGRVVNFQRLSFQQNLLIASGVMAVVGAIFSVLGSKAPINQPHLTNAAQLPVVHDQNVEPSEAFAEAIRKGDALTMRRLLLTKTISPHGRNRNGRGWLQYATATRGLEPCRVLVEHGAMPTDKDDLGTTSLDIATSQSNQELVALFTLLNRPVF